MPIPSSKLSCSVMVQNLFSSEILLALKLTMGLGAIKASFGLKNSKKRLATTKLMMVSSTCHTTYIIVTFVLPGSTTMDMKDIEPLG